MSFTTNEMSAADIAAVTGGGRGYGNGFGDGDGWWIILFLILAMGGNWGNGFGGNGGGSVPWFMNTDSDVERGFDQMATMNGIQNLQSTVSNGFANAATQLCNCCGDMQMQMANGFAGVEAGANARQMADMNQNFALQTAMMQGFNGVQSQLSDCCCENRLATANLGSDIAREACATRTNDTQNTQAILNAMNAGFQELQKQNFVDKIDAKNDEIAQLRQEVLFARGQSSQVAQNSAIINGVYNRLNECPVGTVPVYGEQPIFSCPSNSNCGCGGFGLAA